MKRHCRMLVLFLLAGVFGGSAVPPVDLPETAFDESDTPVNLAPASQTPPQTPLGFARPVSVPLVMPGCGSTVQGALSAVGCSEQ